MKLLLTTFLACAALLSANEKKPNIILIMADDLGYECIAANGADDYKTPVLDKMAAEGVRFTNCFANPVCTPSRVKIMTGMSNIRNYVQFRILDRDQKTFAHYLKDAGYRTAITGKWQLGKEEDSAQHFGFEQSMLWQHTRGARKTGTKFDSRFVNPQFEKNGKPVDFNNGEFSSDICVDFINDFITKHKDEPVFVYYPMILTHCPFVPTPGTPDFDPKSKGSPTYKGKAKYFGDMVHYTDKMVGRIQAHLEKEGLLENTIIIFTGDNGTDSPVKTMWKGKEIKAGKGKLRETGIRVPLIVSYPNNMKPGTVTDELVDFSDFLPTFCDAAGVKAGDKVDGVSILPALKGEQRNKPYSYIWYNKNGNKPSTAKSMARTKTRLLYRQGVEGPYTFIDSTSIFDEKELTDNLSEEDKKVMATLKEVMKKHDQTHQSALKAE